MKKNDDRTCLVIVVSIVLLFILYQAVKFFRQPDAIRQIFDFFAAIGLCLGAAVLLMSCIILYETISTRIENRFIRQSKDYPGRCFLVKMEAFDGFGPIPDDLPEVVAKVRALADQVR
jgi:multisubunit Na+/H+ antiporter MnhB subunit